MGKSEHVCAITSFTKQFHSLTTLCGFSECIAWNGRGEISWMSVPTLSIRSRCFWPNSAMRDSGILGRPWSGLRRLALIWAL